MNLVNDDSNQLALKWLRHLSYLVEDRLLFKEALKTYDLRIASLVAQASNQVDYF